MRRWAARAVLVAEAARCFGALAQPGCSVGIATWEADWSEEKKAECCQLVGLGCQGDTPPATHNCGEGAADWRDSWTPSKRTWCCHRDGLGCSQQSADGGAPSDVAFDCDAGFAKWRDGWSQEKQDWCCQREGRGCCAGDCPRAKAQPGYDCLADFSKWRDGWTGEKQVWCCSNYRRGCPEYDCDAGFANWQAGWSEEKKAWCCQQAGRGCQPPSPPPTTPLTFDCDAGFANWARGWSPRKQQWCCQREGRGCPTPPPPTTTTEFVFDCEAGWANWERGWSQRKKDWCCQHAGRGCATSTSSPRYDCERDFWNWEAEWGKNQMAWCCEHTGRGCSTTGAPTTTTALAFDCQAGLANWRLGWSEEKKRWCCERTGAGCPDPSTTPAPYDCQAGYRNWREGWSDAKKAWCCQSAGLGCDDGGGDRGDRGREGNRQIVIVSCPQAPCPSPPCGSRPCPAPQYIPVPVPSPVPGPTQYIPIPEPYPVPGPTQYIPVPMPVTLATTRAPPTVTSTTVTTTTMTSTTVTTTTNTFTGTTTTTTRTTTTVTTTTFTTTTLVTTTTTSTRTSSTSTTTSVTTTTALVTQTSTTTTITKTLPPPPPPKKTTLPPTTTVTTTTQPRPTTTTRASRCLPSPLSCNLNCYGTAATPIHLAGATGSGSNLAVPDLTLEECRAACRNDMECEAIVHQATGKGMCYGKRDVKTSGAEGGCQVQSPYITEMICGEPWGKCTLLGDPHITSFDRKMLGSYPASAPDEYMVPVDMYDHGEYHVVDSTQISIHGRFGYTSVYTSAASTLGVAATGQLMGGHTLAVAYVGPVPQSPAYRGWKVTWDGAEILAGFPSSYYQKDINATFDSMDPTNFAVRARSTIGTQPGNLPSYVFNLGPQQEVQIYVLPGDELCNVVVTMRRIPDQDGLCGNFNCDWNDDATVVGRAGMYYAVPKADTLFPPMLDSPPGWDTRTGPSASEIVDLCPDSVKQHSGCAGTPSEMESCLFDACSRAVDGNGVGAKFSLSGLFIKVTHPGARARVVQSFASIGTLAGFLAVVYMWWFGRGALFGAAYAPLPRGGVRQATAGAGTGALGYALLPTDDAGPL